jgi:hypothetical protein
MGKNSALTVADLDNIVTENFAPDIKKLAHEVGANLDNPVALRAIGLHIVASYGVQALRDVYCYVRTIYGGHEGDQWNNRRNPRVLPSLSRAEEEDNQSRSRCAAHRCPGQASRK